MQTATSHLVDFAILTPMILAQVGIAYVLLRRFPSRRNLLRVLFVIAALIFAGGILMGFQDVVRWVGPRWPRLRILEAITFLWGFSSTIAFAIYVVLSRAVRPRPEFDDSRRRILRTASYAAIAAPFAATAFGAIVQRTRFEVREVDLPIKDLARDLEGLRILQLSDIHLSAYLSERELARVIEMSQELRPQLALITGDLITGAGDPLDACISQLARLRADAGIFGCLGNHEVYARAEAYTTAQAARNGITFLRRQNRVLQFGSARLNLAGVDYQPFQSKENYLKGAEKLVVPGVTNVLLSHNPDVFPVAKAQGWDLTLSGHTHGGQVTVEILDQTLNVARIYTRFVSGYYRQGHASCYVTRGIGTIGIPARLGAPPEITLLRLRRA